MSGQGDRYDLEEVQELAPKPILQQQELSVEVINKATDASVIEFLIEEHEIDIKYDNKRGEGAVRDAILESDLTPFELKQRVAARGDETPEEILVPDSARKAALGALRTGKPVVLYGPTGTGKTTFAKQLALETSVGYNLETASPSWTSQDIVGRIAPDYSEDSVSYRKEMGCVSEAVFRARKYDEDYSVIIDEITRADISKIFGPLYTAIENPHQAIFETEAGEIIKLDPDVNIICTMNMSDRTVNQLDNAITRRFAMIEISSYDKESAENLFSKWISNHLSGSKIDTGALQSLLYDDYDSLNYSSDGETDSGIIQFGPMHYRDVVVFLGEVTQEDGEYAGEPAEAVGQAFRIYILPRLLNTASYSQINDLIDHYRVLNEDYEEFELSPAIELATNTLNAEEQRMGVSQ
jgi:5-methylcytosine-specific restriction protein B